MKIYALTDYMASIGQSQAEEYAEIKQILAEIIKHDFIWKTNIPPWKLGNEKIDVYVIDYGGLWAGCEDAVSSMFRALIKQIHEKPGTLFVIWSLFSQRYYLEAMHEFAPELSGHNVVYYSADNFKDKLLNWLDIL